ncbi:MAG: helix-turn-helix transcriptional regulator [Nitrospinales bacterium]
MPNTKEKLTPNEDGALVPDRSVTMELSPEVLTKMIGRKITDEETSQFFEGHPDETLSHATREKVALSAVEIIDDISETLPGLDELSAEIGASFKTILIIVEQQTLLVGKVPLANTASEFTSIAEDMRKALVNMDETVQAIQQIINKNNRKIGELSIVIGDLYCVSNAISKTFSLANQSLFPTNFLLKPPETALTEEDYRIEVGRDMPEGSLLEVSKKAEHPGTKVKAMVLAHGISLREAARRIDVGHNVLSDLFNKKTPLTEKLAARLEKHFGFDLTEEVKEQAVFTLQDCRKKLDKDLENVQP